MNRHISTGIIAPMKMRGRDNPTRMACYFDGKDGQIALDQVQTVGKSRLVKKLGRINVSAQRAILTVLGKLFDAQAIADFCSIAQPRLPGRC